MVTYLARKGIPISRAVGKRHDKARHAPHEWQDRAVHPDPVVEMGLWMPFQTSQERKRWLPRYLRLYSQHRCHMANGGLSPQQRQAVLLAE